MFSVISIFSGVVWTFLARNRVFYSACFVRSHDYIQIRTLVVNKQTTSNDCSRERLMDDVKTRVKNDSAVDGPRADNSPVGSGCFRTFHAFRVERFEYISNAANASRGRVFENVASCVNTRACTVVAYGGPDPQRAAVAKLPIRSAPPYGGRPSIWGNDVHEKLARF